jgi:hypothetical protein
VRAGLIPAAGALIGAALAAGPARAAPPVERIKLTACPYAGVTAPCLMIKGADGTVYNITSVTPKPPLNRMIRLRATVTDKLSVCAQGIVLDRIRWTGVPQRCAN